MLSPTRRTRGAVLAPRTVAGLAAALTLLVTGCADFPDQSAPKDWTAQPSLTPESGPTPQLPGEANGGAPGAPTTPPQPSSIPPPKGCRDFDPSVIATCLDEVAAVAALPGSQSDPAGFAAERRSGRVLQVHKGADPVQVARLSVDATGDGGLTGLALSPSYDEDQLVYAYITTNTDNRVVRFTVGDPPKPVLTGIPRGPTGNRGALAVDHSGALLVATGDAGRSDAANDTGSLAGKVLRIDTAGKPAKGNPQPGSATVASGLHSPGGLCNSADGKTSWVTDRAPNADTLYRLNGSGKLGTPAWRWSNRIGVAGCAAFSDSVLVAGATAGNVQSLTLNSDGSFSGAPRVTMQGANGYGRIDGVDIIGDVGALVGTVNKAGGKPVSSDDRVVVIVPQGGAGGGRD